MHFQTSGHLPALRDLIYPPIWHRMALHGFERVAHSDEDFVICLVGTPQVGISTRLIIIAEILGGIRWVAQHIDGVALQQ